MSSQLDQVQARIDDGTVGIRFVMPLINEWLREHPDLKLPAADWILHSTHPAAVLFRSKLGITQEPENRQAESTQEDPPQLMTLRPSFWLQTALGSIYCRAMDRDLVYTGYKGEDLVPLLVTLPGGRGEQPVQMTGKFRRSETGSWQTRLHAMMVWTGPDDDKNVIWGSHVRQEITQAVSGALEQFRKENEEEFQLAAYIAVNNKMFYAAARGEEIAKRIDKLRRKMEVIRSGV